MVEAYLLSLMGVVGAFISPSSVGELFLSGTCFLMDALQRGENQEG